MADSLELAGRVWPVLTESAAKRQVLTYGEVAPRIGAGLPIVVRHALHPIYLLCGEKGWPHLTGIVVNASSRRPGAGFDAWPDTELNARWAEVFDFGWGQVAAPFQESTFTDPVECIKRGDYSVPDTVVEVNGRGAYQAAFRRRLFQAYGSRCALCDTRMPSLLVASHIVPWAQDQANRCNPRNGLLLCRCHDTLFEQGIVRVNEDLSIDVRAPDKDPGSVVRSTLKGGTASVLRVAQASANPEPRFLRARLDMY